MVVHIAPSALESPPSGATVGPPPGPTFATPRRRRRPNRVGGLLLLLVVVAVASAAGVLATAKRQVDRIARIEGLDTVLSPPGGSVENFLLVGSDSRAGADPSDPDFGAIGGVDDVSGNRSDTIMVLRRDRNGGPASLLSLPRDLWVDIPGRDNPSRINAAYQDGPATLIRTVQQSLGIPIHHYVEIDFQGFKSLVDAIGGVQVCFWTPARDTHTGFFVETPGCHVLDGVQGLAYARSRYYETYENDEWKPDPTSDLGRIKRQQQFINTALHAAIAKVKSNPLKAGDVLVTSTGALRIDSGLDVIAAAGAMREAVGDGLQTYSPPVYGKTINGNAVLLLGDGWQAFHDYFSGVSNTPPVSA
jgi:LCP family protein required for cell wall assembly